MYEIIAANQFKKDYKKCIKRNFKIELLDKAVLKMAELGTLPQTYKPLYFLVVMPDTGNVT